MLLDSISTCYVCFRGADRRRVPLQPDRAGSPRVSRGDSEDDVWSKTGEDTVVELDEGFGDETEIEDLTMPHEELDQLLPALKGPASKRTLILPVEEEQQQLEQQPTEELDPEVSSQTRILLSDYSLVSMSFNPHKYMCTYINNNQQKSWIQNYVHLTGFYYQANL